MLKHCAANRKRRLSALPNVGRYIYTMLKFLAFQGAAFIYDISWLRVKDTAENYTECCYWANGNSQNRFKFLIKFFYQHLLNVMVHFSYYCEALYVRNVPKYDLQNIFHKWLPRSEGLLGFTQSSENAVLTFQPVPTRRQFIILIGLNTSPDKLKLLFDFFYLSCILQIMLIFLYQCNILHMKLMVS
jgi:hypothetical protein